jgi:hypothetical protein
MKTTSFASSVILLSVAVAIGQGTFIYDQQAGPNPPSGLYETVPAAFGSFPPTYIVGESFTPTLSSVGFFTLALGTAPQSYEGGTTLYVNLRQGSITGPVLGTTAPILVPANSPVSALTLSLPSPVPISPGTTYFFDLEIPYLNSFNGTTVNNSALTFTGGTNYTYSGGELYVGGQAYPNNTLWFREGIVVPEPGSGALLLLACGALAPFGRRLSRARVCSQPQRWLEQFDRRL